MKQARVETLVANHAFHNSEFSPVQQALDARFIHHDPKNLVGSERYIELLGADVDQTRHMQRTLVLANAYVRQHNTLCASDTTLVPITEQESELLQLAAITHDWGEVKVGDIKYDLKTESDEEHEKHAYQEIFEQLDIQDELPAGTLEELLSIIFDKTSRLGLIFDSIERVGYLLTAQRAHRMITQMGLKNAELSQMTRISKEVPGRHISVLHNRAHDWPVGARVASKVENILKETA